MRLRDPRNNRRGAIIAYIAAGNVFVLALVALAIDIGMVAVAKTQAQNAADTAALAGVRTFTGQAGYNLSNVPVNAVTAATQNKIFSNYVTGDPKSINNLSTDVYTSGSVTVECGGYYYVYNDNNPSAEGFQIVVPGKSASEPYTAVRVTIQTTSPIFFGSIWGASPFNVKAHAGAAHRPRDVVIIMDLSGSMRFESSPGAYADGSGYAYPHWGPRNVSMNPETIYPQFGHYSNTAAAALMGNTSMPSQDVMVDPANISVKTNGGDAVIPYFMSSGSTPAWVRDSTKDGYATAPGGDNYLKTGGGNYVQTVTDYLGASPTNAQLIAWCRGTGNPPKSSTAGYGSTFNGYTEGPGFWGKTFFIWPPDPRGSDLDANNYVNHADNGAKDWRQRFFFKQDTKTNLLYWLDHNNVLFDPKGSPATSDGSGVTPILKQPQDTTTVTENGNSITYRYLINYAAVFQWLRNSAPTHFPASMTTGRINFYTSIPDPTVDAGFNNRFWTQSPMTSLNERFWKDYIDFVFGLVETGANTYSNTDGWNPWASYIGNGDYFQWGTVQITQKQDCNFYGSINNVGGYAAGATSVNVNSFINVSGGTTTPAVNQYVRFGYGTTLYLITAVSSSTGTYTLTLDQGLTVSVANSSTVKFYTSIPQYMNYLDNPYRPRHQFWFGPMTWTDWLGNYERYVLRWPGNLPEAQAWACKIGISAAIDDIKSNHPNDFVGLTFFSTPNYSTGGGGQFNMPVVPLGRSYQNLKDSLWFPPSTVAGVATTITPYDSDFANVPRAHGGTAPEMGFMLAYNLMSSSATNLRTYATPFSTYRGYDGGLGRKGASRLVIFETDGAPNSRADASIVGAGADSYYPIRIKDPTDITNGQNEFPNWGSYSDSEVFTVVQQITAMNTASPPGYSTPRKQALVYSIGYGSLFDPANSTLPRQSAALTFLQSVQYYGNVSKDMNGANFPDNQLVYGSLANRQTRIQTAFTNIMQAGVQVSLLE